MASTDPLPWDAQPFRPPAVPVAVRSPYLNAWMAQWNTPQFNTMWTRSWPDNGDLGWYVAVMVDNIPYRILGRVSPDEITVPPQTSVEFTPTRTTVMSTVGPVDVNMTFWSPIEPDDIIRQSFPGVYLGVGIKSRDGAAHNVSVYSDITGEWITGDNGLFSNWTNTDTGDLVYHQAQLVTRTPYLEIRDISQDASAFYGMEKRDGLTYMIGSDSTTRSTFSRIGALTNEIDTDFRPVGRNFTVYGLSVALGNIVDTDDQSMVVYSLAILRDPAVRFVNPDGTDQNRSPAYLSEYSSRQTAYEQFAKDQSRARSAAASLDARLLADANAISPEYANLISLVSRQVMGAGEITMGRGAGGEWNKTDVMMFVKDMGALGAGDGNVNPVDVLYAAFPAYLYLNPDLGGYALSPLLLAQSSPIFPQAYASPDLGGPYPNATGNSNAHNMGVDHTASMLIMVLAQAQASGKRELIDAYYPLLKKWGDYLVDNTFALGTGEQVAVDSVVGSNLPQTNQTNLAIKGVLGISAMAKISDAAGMGDDATRYGDTSRRMLDEWIPLALSSDRSSVLANFNSQSSSVLLYNLFADKLLRLGLVSDEVYQAQAVSVAGSGSQYGLPLSSFDPQISRTDWMMFTAASLSSTQTRNTLISQLQTYASAQRNSTPFAVTYDPTTGVAGWDPSGSNSAAHGAIFSLLALTKEVLPIGSTTSGQTGTSSSSSNIGPIVGGVIGGIVVLGILAYLAFFYYRRRRVQRQRRVVDTPAPGAYESHESDPGLSVRDTKASMPNLGKGATSITPPMSYANSDNEASSSLLAGGPTYAQSSDLTASDVGGRSADGLLADAATPGVGPGSLSPGLQSSNNRGSTYFRQREDVSDIGPSASQVGALSSVSGSGTGSGSGSMSMTTMATGLSSGTFRIRNTSHTSTDITQPTSQANSMTVNPSFSTVSQAVPSKRVPANDDLRAEVDSLRREVERLREERSTPPIVSAEVPRDEAPPSYFQHTNTRLVTIPRR